MAAKRSGGRKYSRAASKSVKRAVGKQKRGTLKAGRGRRGNAKSREQAIAIGLNEARAKGAKVPAKKKSAAKKSTRKRSAAKSARKRTARKSTRKRAASKRR